ncbi:polysaccharide deacetylase family protein [Anaerolentibacter hominis]|uniref:polysaccharide deacetylase family protein n=1 Tax=Anaerolentibacter hominis TaxID=3079009 RepID=UPI0031B853D5
MDVKREKEKILSFVKTGLLVLSLIAVAGIGMKVVPAAVTVTNQSNGKELPIYCVDTEEKKVALSFDAAWGDEDTEAILKILDDFDIKVTFFMTGGWVEKYPDDVKAIAAAGHDLGNHSETHKQMSALSKEECLEEIKKPHEKVKALTGIEMNLFRPPYGDYNNTLVNSVKESGYHCIQWSVDSLDWKDYGTDNIISTVLDHKALDNGAIILMHNGARYTREALPAIIKGLQDKGYEIVPISQLIHTGDYYMDNTGKQFAK